MNSGECSPHQIRGWVANRFYYQINIPLKDAAILSNCPDRHTRRLWIQRLVDHDGTGDDAGGIEAWVRLADAVGLERDAEVLVVVGPEQVRQGLRGHPDLAEQDDRDEPPAGVRVGK